MSSSAHAPTDPVKSATGVSPYQCYQCGKCSAGCPVAEDMDFPPSMVMRLLQTGDSGHFEKALGSFSIWMCLTCETCYCRCPMSIDIPAVMDFLRQKAYETGKVHPKAKKIVAFHESFLKTLEQNGKLSEVGLLAYYKMKTGTLLKDVGLAPKMISRGKLHILPERVKGTSEIASIFKKTKNH